MLLNRVAQLKRKWWLRTEPASTGSREGAFRGSTSVVQQELPNSHPPGKLRPPTEHGNTQEPHISTFLNPSCAAAALVAFCVTWLGTLTVYETKANVFTCVKAGCSCCCCSTRFHLRFLLCCPRNLHPPWRGGEEMGMG